MKSKVISVLILLFSLCTILFSASKIGPTNLEVKALNYIENKDYKNAITLIKSNLTSFTYKEKMLYLMARSYENSNQLNEALNLYNEFIKKYPASKWLKKCYYRKAQIFTQQKKYSDAYSILKEQLQSLLSKERRNKLSEIYLNLAEKMAPGILKDENGKQNTDNKEKNDYHNALLFYNRAIEIGYFDEREADILYRIGLCNYYLNNYYQAKINYTDFIKKFPQSNLLKKVYFYLGEIESKLGDNYKSRNHYFEVLKNEKPQDKELTYSPKAYYQIGKSYGLPYPSTEEDLELGVKYWRILIEKYPTHKLSSKAAYEIGISYNRFANTKKQSIIELTNFVEKYSKDENAPLALYEVAKIYFYLNDHDECIKTYKKFLKDYPDHKLWPQVQKEIMNTLVSKGDYYLNLKKYDDAEQVYQTFLSEYPIDYRNPNILYNLADIAFMKKNYDLSIELWNKLFSKYPSNSISHRALYSIGKTYVDHKNDFEKGIETFKKVLLYPWRNNAQNEIRLLKEKSLNIETKKLFLSTESPSINIKLRNIEEFAVNIYKIDLKEYFRRNHSIGNIEQLDILLIKPAKSFTHKLGNYQKYKLFTLDQDLKINKPGAYVISVTSETLKASSLVLVSDIGIIIQGNQREVLIFTKNLLKNKGESKTQVLVSNGEKIILEGETDETGIFTHRFSKSEKKLDLNKLTVFVEKNNHFAGTGISTGSFIKQDEKEYLSYIYSDKPVYKPGDSFSYKAILRSLHRGNLGKIKQKDFMIQFISSSGESIYEKTISQNDFGTLSGSLNLPTTIATGWGKLRIESVKDKSISFEQQFEVSEYTKLEKEILFETDKIAYFPREPIKLKIIGKHLFGLPAAEKNLFYKIENESYNSIPLNKEGEFTLNIDSVKYGRRDYIRIYAYLEGGNKVFEKQIPIVIRDFSISLKAKQEIYLPSEKAELEIKTTDFFGKGISKDLKVKLFLLEDSKEMLTSEQNIKTDDKGIAMANFTFKSGGNYLVNVEGIGYNDIPVRAKIYFNTVKEKEKRKLFILCENRNYKLNETINMKIYSQGKSGLALLTIKGDNLLSHKLISIKSGINPLSITIGERHVPNFNLSINLLKREDFYFVEKEFQVDSGIDIKISTDKEIYKPGETVTLTIETKGADKKALSAESSIVLVDEGVLLLAGLRLSEIKNYFYRTRRFPNHSIAGSTPYKYLSTTEIRNLEIAKTEKEVEEKRLSRGYRSKKSFKKRLDSFGLGYGADLAKPPSGAEKSYDAPRLAQESPKDALYEGDKGSSSGEQNTISSVRELLPDTAYFNPRVISDNSGNASVKIKLPNSLNKWRIIVISTTKGSQFGMNQKPFSVKKDFLVHLETPVALTEGDLFSFDGDLLNSSDSAKEGNLKLITGKNTDSISFNVNSNGHFPFKSKEINAEGKNIKVTGITEHDGEKRLISITPWGSTTYKGVTGSTENEKTEWVTLDNLKENDLKLNLTLYPNFNQVLFYINDYISLSNYIFLNQVASHLIAKISLYKYLNLYEKDRTGDIRRLRDEINDKINFLHSSMNMSGGWNWIYKRGDQDITISSYIYYALSMAKALKFNVKPLLIDKSTHFLNQSFSSMSNDNLETKIFILFALSENDKANYSYVNRIYRNRHSLSLRGLNFLALTLHNMKRSGEAAEILSIIQEKIKNPSFKISPTEENKIINLDFFSSKDEIIGLTILSLLKIKKYTLKAKPFLVKLLSSFSKRIYLTHEFLGLISQSVSEYLLVQKPSETDFMLTVKLNDSTIFDKRITGINSPQNLIVTKGITQKNKLEFIVKGKGEIFYSGMFSFFNPGIITEKVKKHGTLKKYLEYPDYKLNNTSFNWSYSTIQDNLYSYTRQKLGKVAQHVIFPVAIDIFLYKNMPETYFILEDTIPAGCKLLQDSVSGNFQYFRQEKNKLIFYIKRNYNNSSSVNIKYKLISRFQGTYKTLPPELYPIRNREKLITGEKNELVISDSQYNTFNEYKFSPDENYHIGKYYFDKSNYKESESYLIKVFTEHTLKDVYYKDVCRMLLYISLHNKNDQDVVKYFELLKERYPELTIPFKEVIEVADSYKNIGESERAIQVLNGTFNSYFLQEVAISGTLSRLDKIEEAYKLINQLVMDYPDFSVVLKTFYTFAQDIYLRYTELTEKPDAKKAKEKKLDPNRLFQISKTIFKNYLTYYPEDWNTDEVSFTLLNLYLDHKNYKLTTQNALQYIKRYSKSQFLDGYKYIAAHALFRKGDYNLAYKLSQSVAYDKFPGTGDAMRESKNKHFAILMLAKIYHYQKDFIRALNEYKKISEQFEEAKRSIEFIEEKKILLKEVTQIKTKEKNKIELTLKGVNNVLLKLYKVNFIILSLKEKDLTNITKINLSGIKPFYEKNYKLSSEIPYTPIKKTITLPIKDVGAYLLVFKSKDIQGSGIILKSDLSFDAIEKTESGRVRVTVLDDKNNFLKDVKIKFIGSGDNQYKSAVTDLRGTAEIDNFSNLTLVVGEKDGHYCFYRGKQPVIDKRRIDTLLNDKIRAPRPQQPVRSDYLEAENDVLMNVRKRRSEIQQSNKAAWDDQSQKADIKGVEVQATK